MFIPTIIASFFYLETPSRPNRGRLSPILDALQNMPLDIMYLTFGCGAALGVLVAIVFKKFHNYSANKQFMESENGMHAWESNNP